MSTELQSAFASVAVASPVAAQPADPWDAPYFGGRVYLAYRPTLAGATPATPPATPSAGPVTAAAPVPHEAPVGAGYAALGLDPWDAPYFGGPVYFRYPDYPVRVAGFAAAAPSPAAATATPRVVLPPPAPQHATPSSARRGFFARLFGRR